jgi:putative ABC transport system permease protein
MDAEGMVSEVVAFLPREGLAMDLQREHQAALESQGLVTQTWKERAAPVLGVNEVRRRSLNMLVLLIFVVAASGIANTLVMSAFERVREIGTLRALGLQTGQVTALLMLEATVIGLMGALVGTLLGSAVVYSMRDGIDVSRMLASGNITVSMSTLLYLELSPGRALSAFLVGLIIAALSSLYPAIKFSRISPMEAMKR